MKQFIILLTVILFIQYNNSYACPACAKNYYIECITKAKSNKEKLICLKEYEKDLILWIDLFKRYNDPLVKHLQNNLKSIQRVIFKLEKKVKDQNNKITSS